VREKVYTEDGQELVKVERRDRKTIEAAVSTNRRANANWEFIQGIRKGPGSCVYCGAEPCGRLWKRPGDAEPGGERCCDKCTHQPLDGWLHTHTVFKDGKRFPVCALRMREGETVFLRRDGVVHFLELHAPPEEFGGEPNEKVPHPVFLGEPAQCQLFFADEGGPEAPNLWLRRARVDDLWLAIRVQAALAHDEERRVQIRKHMAEVDAMLDRRYAEVLAEQEKKRNADIERKALKHETVTVLRELAELEAAVENEPSAEVAATATEPTTVFEPVPALSTPAEKPDPAAKWREAQKLVAGEDLKRPRAPKPTGGRLKRSKRQNAALERKKRVVAMREAKARLEVKRLQRLAGNGSDVVKDEP
jgi:hypothetical protein